MDALSDVTFCKYTINECVEAGVLVELKAEPRPVFSPHGAIKR